MPNLDTTIHWSIRSTIQDPKYSYLFDFYKIISALKLLFFKSKVKTKNNTVAVLAVLYCMFVGIECFCINCIWLAWLWQAGQTKLMQIWHWLLTNHLVILQPIEIGALFYSVILTAGLLIFFKCFVFKSRLFRLIAEN